jgi:hypothetical protein
MSSNDFIDKIANMYRDIDPLALSLPSSVYARITAPRPAGRMQKVIKEADVAKHLDQEWTFVIQLKSGDVIVEKPLDIGQALDVGIEQIKKQARQQV